MEILGGKIINGTAKTKGDNIFVIGSAANATKLTIGGDAQISGGIVTGANVDITLRGNPKIKTSDIDGMDPNVTVTNGLEVTNSSNINVDGLTADAEIQVTGEVGTVFATSENADELKTYFKTTDAEQKVEAEEDHLKIYKADVQVPEKGEFDPVACGGRAYCPVCGTIVEWEAIDSNYDGTALGKDKHYYLSEDLIEVSVEGRDAYLTKVNGGVTCLNLNGKQLSTTDGRVFLSNFNQGVLNVVDTEGGAVVTGCCNGAAGAVFHINGAKGSCTVNVYGGTFKKVNKEEFADGDMSPVVYIGGNGGAFNMYEGATIDTAGVQNRFYPTAVYVQGGVLQEAVENNYNAPGAFTMYGGTIIGGHSTGDGGAVLIGNANGAPATSIQVATFTMKSGTIYGGTTTGSNGGNVAIINDNTFVMEGGVIVGDVLLQDATAYNTQTEATLSGAAQIVKEHDGKKANRSGLHIGDNTVLNVDGLTEGAMIYIHGAVDSETDAVETVLFTSENAEAVKEYILPYYDEYYVNVADGNFSLRKNGAAIVTEDGRVFYKTFDDALVNYDISNKAYLEVHKYNQTINLTGDAYIDNRGITVAVTGTGNCTLYIMDSANDNYDGYNNWTVNGDVSVAPEAINPINGRRYISIKETDAQGNIRYNAHRIQMYLTGISLRPTAVGLYYKANYKCDSKLAALVTQYGIVYNAENEILKFNASGNVESIITGFADKMENHAVTGTSSLVYGIFKESNKPEGNRSNGETAINATPYIMIGEQVVLGNVENTVHNAAYLKNNGKVHAAMSMYDVLETMNNAWNNTEGLVLTDAQKTSLKTFYITWKDLGMSEWKEELPNISDYVASGEEA